MKFIKKPVAIEAVILEKSYKSIAHAFTFMGIKHQGGTVQTEKFHEYCDNLNSGGGLTIHTLEGDHLARWGDYIIKGIKGEFYPCKPDIFKATYYTEEEYAALK